MYKLLLTDLDETLLVDHHVPVENLEAIKKAKEKGTYVVPCTGRGYELIKDVLCELETYDKPNEYSICFNGGMVVENKNRKVLFFKGLEYECLKKLVELSNNYEVGLMLFTIDKCYMINPGQSEIDRKIAQNADFEILDIGADISFLKDNQIAKVLYIKEDMNYLRKIVSELQDDLNKLNVAISYSSHRYLEFNALGVNKGSGLHFLANYLQIPVSEVIAVGDNYNDVEMIKEAGLGVCVAGGYDDIKSLAKYVTENDYDKGAVKEVIEKFILVEEETNGI